MGTSAVGPGAVRGVRGPAAGVRTLDELVLDLRTLRAEAGHPSYSEIVRRITAARTRRGLPEHECVPGRITVYDCFRIGRRRMDPELLADVAQALGADPAPWRIALSRALTCPPPPPPGTADDPHTGAGAGAGWAEDCPGRERELVWLLGVKQGVTVVAGMPGVGKSRLALCAARRMAGPGRRLRATLRGFEPGGPPADPHVVLGELLRGLGVPEERVRRLGRAERGALYRRLTAERAMVVVLDDAAAAGQIRELLPGGSARAVVTSRRELPGLDAPTLTLAPLAPHDSLTVLAGVLGEDRLGAEPVAAARIAAACGHLPLELTAAAGQIARRPGWSLDDHLHLLESGPGSRALNTALDASYHRLDESARGMFRLLGLHPGGVITCRAAAALGACPETLAAGALGRLRAHHLLMPARREDAGTAATGATARTGGNAPGYVLHDLVRRYARRLVEAHVPYSAQRKAVDRLAESGRTGRSA